MVWGRFCSFVFISGSFREAGFCCEYFWFSLLLVFLFSLNFFFFLVDFWYFLLCHSCSQDPLYPPPASSPLLGWRTNVGGVRGVGGEAWRALTRPWPLPRVPLGLRGSVLPPHCKWRMMRTKKKTRRAQETCWRWRLPQLQPLLRPGPRLVGH